MQLFFNMNILIINPILSTSEKGVITRRKSIKDCMICNFAQGFVNARHSVTILASEEFRPLQPETYDYQVVFFPSRLTKIFKPDLIPFPVGMRKWMKLNQHKFDFAIASEAFSITSLIATRIFGPRLIIWQEMSFHQHKFFKLPARTWYNIVVPTLMRRPLMVPRSIPARKFISRYSRNVSHTCIDHGANGNLLFPSSEVAPHFIVISQLIPRKNIEGILRKFAHFLQHFPQYKHYKLKIIGDGPLSQTLINQASELGISENTIFCGFMRHQEMAQNLRTATAMLINTFKDNNMVSIPEAIISGTPIVTNSIPTNSSFISEHHLGIVRSDWDHNDLAEAITRYPSFHANCVAIRDSLTNDGCARRMVQVFQEEILPRL